MARRGSGYLTVDVDVDLNEALEAITDDDLLDEIQQRKLNLGCPDFEPMDDLKDAYEELLRGRSAAALVILERLLYPKWKSVKACESEFANARRLTK